MPERKDRSYVENKKILEEVFIKLINHPNYINKTYKGLDFCNLLFSWEDAWFTLIYHSIEFDIKKRFLKTPGAAQSFDYKLHQWARWSHNFNIILGRMRCYAENGLFISFRYSDFLEGMVNVTREFIEAKTREEEFKALDVTYEICYNGVDANNGDVYKTRKFIWLTEELLKTKSWKLPMFAPWDLTDYARGKRLYNIYRQKFSGKTMIDLEGLIKKEKENWRCYRVAIKKGILIDNYKGLKRK